MGCFIMESYRRYDMLLQTLPTPISFHVGHNAAVFEQYLLRRQSSSLQVQHSAVQNEPPGLEQFRCLLPSEIIYLCIVVSHTHLLGGVQSLDEFPE